MKKLPLLFLLAGLWLATDAVAQNSAVMNTITYLGDGKLDKAKENIDKAVEHEKTGQKAKTWFYQGQVYQQLAGSLLDQYKELGGNDAVLVAYDAYKKAIELDQEGGRWAKQSEEALGQLWGALANQSILLYQDKDYDQALKMSELAMELNPKDTTPVILSAAYAEANEDFDRAEQYYKQLLTMDYGDEDTYRRLAYYAQKRDDTDQALTYVQQAREKFPDNKDLMLEELNLYFKTGRTDEAREKLEQAVKMDPGNSLLHFNLGALYDEAASAEGITPEEQMSARQKAIASYGRALEADPQNYDAAFNLGAVYYNMGVEEIKTTNNMDLTTYRKEGKAYEERAKGYFEKAAGPFQTAYAINPTDPKLLMSMRTMYQQLGEKEKANRYDKEYETATQ
ncbi:MAG: tetratricopeptide repeat protein [Catalinimonas sp.]